MSNEKREMPEMGGGERFLEIPFLSFLYFKPMRKRKGVGGWVDLRYRR